VLVVTGTTDVLAGPRRLEALGEEREKLFRGPKAALLPRVHSSIRPSNWR
jgi:hypothetical protein